MACSLSRDDNKTTFLIPSVYQSELTFMVPHTAYFSVGFDVDGMPYRGHCGEHSWEGKRFEEGTLGAGYINSCRTDF